MATEFTRRNFIKAAGATAGVAVAVGASPLSYAQNEKVRLGIIGTGKQGQIAHIGQGLTVNKDAIQIVSICDIWSYNRDIATKLITETQGLAKPGDLKVYIDYKEMIEKEELDAVLIATPLSTHYQIVMDCLDAGLYVFCEKTMTMTIEESRNIVKKCNETGKFVQIGHQRHYNPFYNKAMWLANDKNQLGRITHITAQWHRNESWTRTLPKGYVMTAEDQKWIGTEKDLEKLVNWRLYNDMSAGLMTELGTHQMDVASWFLGSIPTRVSGLGGLEYWRDGRDAEDHTVLLYEWTVKPGDLGYRQIERRHPDQSKAKINLPYKVRMTYSSICTNAQAHYGELIQGERGAYALLGEQMLDFFPEPWYQLYLKQKAERAAGQKVAATTTNSYVPGAGGNVGIPVQVYTGPNGETAYDVWMANHNQWAAFAKDVKANTPPKANQMTGLVSAVCAHKGNDAIRANTTVDIDPELLAFDFETPDPFRYDPVEGPDLKQTMASVKKQKIEDAKKTLEEAAKEAEGEATGA